MKAVRRNGKPPYTTSSGMKKRTEGLKTLLKEERIGKR